jgi:DNA-binding NarL/FixJ family response regulator
MTQRTLALIVASPGVLREGLRAAVAALHDLETVGEADNVAQAVVMVHDPALVLLSIEGPDQNDLAPIREIKARWPATRCIVLVDTVAQQRAAQAVGAEEVLIKGVLPSKLLGRIEGLLVEQGPEALEAESPGGSGSRRVI